jgi:hypothetical protein
VDDWRVRRDDDSPPIDIEVLDAGPTGDAGDVRRPIRRWLPRVFAGVIAAAVVATVVVRANNEPSAARGAHPLVGTHASSGESDDSPRPSSAAPQAPPVVVTEVAHPLLGVTGSWELFGRGDEAVVRIQLALGRITRTTVAAVQSSGPVSFIAGADRAIIRPLDYVPGYVIPDGQPARDMSAGLSDGGPMFPGPDLNHIWVESGDNGHTTMVLVSLDGRVRQQSVPVPEGMFPVADGAGYLLLVGAHGVDDARGGRLHRITTGSLLAVGPTGWLAAECDLQHQCATVAIQRADDSRHVIGSAVDVGESPGVISPNGATAAVFNTGPTGTVTLSLITLNSGRQQPVDVDLNPRQVDGTIVWSPDSRSLFAATANGSLTAINADTARVSNLGTPLPPLSQLAIRNIPPTLRVTRFHKAAFTDGAGFGEAAFTDGAGFGEAAFTGYAVFDRAALASTTTFRGARVLNLDTEFARSCA